MERNISKTLFRKFRSTSRGSPFSEKFGNTRYFLLHLAFHHQIDLPEKAHAGSWLANICFLGAMNGRPCGLPAGMRPVWITPWQRT